MTTIDRSIAARVRRGVQATRRTRAEHVAGALFSAPFMLYAILIFAVPLGTAVYISFFAYRFTAPGASIEFPFIGLDNYAKIVTDPRTVQSFGNALLAIAITVPVTIGVGLLLALALNSPLRGRGFFRTAYYLPFITAAVALIQVAILVLQPDGLLTSLLGPFAPEDGFLMSPVWAMPIISLFVAWKQLGFFVLLYLGALQSIPTERFEAAEVDGAGAVRRFFHIALPGVAPVTTLVIVLCTITCVNIFTEPYLMTQGGGPDGASTTPGLLIYQQGFQQGNAGYASALGIVIGIFVLVISLLQRRIFRSS